MTIKREDVDESLDYWLKRLRDELFKRYASDMKEFLSNLEESETPSERDEKDGGF